MKNLFIVEEYLGEDGIENAGIFSSKELAVDKMLAIHKFKYIRDGYATFRLAEFELNGKLIRRNTYHINPDFSVEII
jgi:hypothetical protein